MFGLNRSEDICHGLAGAYGNRTHQEPVSRPLTGFEDRAEHQLPTRSQMMQEEDSHKYTRFSALHLTACELGPVDIRVERFSVLR